MTIKLKITLLVIIAAQTTLFQTHFLKADVLNDLPEYECPETPTEASTNKGSSSSAPIVCHSDASPVRSEQCTDNINTLTQTTKALLEHDCDPFMQDPKGAGCACRSILSRASFLKFQTKGEIQVAQWKKALVNIQTLDPTDQKHLLKNLAQIDAKDFEKYIGQISALNCGQHHP